MMDEIRNGECTECEETVNSCKKEERPHLKVWALSYKVSGIKDYEGMAVVVAEDVQGAIRALKAESAHNGTPENMIVGEVTQITFVDVHKNRLVLETFVQVAEEWKILKQK